MLMLLSFCFSSVYVFMNYTLVYFMYFLSVAILIHYVFITIEYFRKTIFNKKFIEENTKNFNEIKNKKGKDEALKQSKILGLQIYQKVTNTYYFGKISLKLFIPALIFFVMFSFMKSDYDQTTFQAYQQWQSTYIEK